MIEFKDISLSYGQDKKVLKNIDIKINKGEFICVVGKSGSGKTSLLRLINKMIKPTSGDVIIDGVNIEEYEGNKLRKEIGYVIQSIGLFPHMTIKENITIIPKLMKWDKEKRHKLAKDLLAKVDLSVDLLDKRPGELSGGQQQRVGVARALAADPNILLFDEPFGALDAITRKSLQRMILELQKSLNKTVVFVTHDIDEALYLADRVLILEEGEIAQFAEPNSIIHTPANDFVKELVTRTQQTK